LEKSQLDLAFEGCKKGLKIVVVFSFFINLLMLTAPIYMLQLFDRVLSSRSTDTLLFLLLIAMFALMVMAMLEVARALVSVLGLSAC